MPETTVLIIDDDLALRRSLALALQAQEHRVVEAGAKREALSRCTDDVDAILLDHQLPDGEGIELIEPLKKLAPDAVVIMMTAHAQVDRAVEAMKRGAFHYAAKPVDLEQLEMLLRAGLETTALRRELRALRADRSRPYGIDAVVGSSPVTTSFKRMLERTAQSPASTVLLLGESGSGKGLAAQIIHHNSGRQHRPFINITCSALPTTLLESELFGHERGAFTDARQQKKGLLELADGGTVFLDEFTETEPLLQAKLLRFLEDKSFRRVGGNKDIRVDVRIIAASNRDLDGAVKNGALRKDLYYRLQVLTIDIPALRERQQDIPLLAKHFVDHFNREFGKEVRGLDPEAIGVLKRHPWEGNVRELRNTIERAMLFAEGGELSADDLQSLARGKTMTEPYLLPPEGIDLDALERSMVEQALERCEGNRTRAGELLGISRDQVRYRIEKFRLE